MSGVLRRASWPSPFAVVCAVAALKLALHLVTLEPYGYFRDELYYLACSDHPALGYVDHPPLSVALLWAWRSLAGDSLVALRTAPAIAGALVVLLTGCITIRLGGGRLAALLACLSVLAAPVRLGVDHVYSMNALDGVLWALAAWLSLRAATEARRGPWIALGVVLGLGLLNKWSALWLGFGLLVGLALTPARRALRTPWPYVAFFIAAALVSPHVAWQARNGWPTLEFMRSAMELKYVRLPLGDFLREVVLMMNPASLLLWATGLVAPFVREDLRRGRLFAWMFLSTFAIVALAKGRPTYLAVAFPMILASGAVAWEHALAAQPRAWVRHGAPAALVAITIGLGAVALPFVLPVLSVERFIAYSKSLGAKPDSGEKKELGPLPQHYADMHGWTELTAAAARAYEALSPEERPGTMIWAVTGGYGPASAIDFFGPRFGLPRAISGHNTYWLWGWGQGDGKSVILLGGSRDRLLTLFEHVTLVTTVECSLCMPYEDHKPVYIGRGMKRGFAEIWPELKHYE